MNSYSIHPHKHRFAAWAASRAASVKGCRFPVGDGQSILAQSSIPKLAVAPELLPAPEELAREHRGWRLEVCRIADSHGHRFTHGVAAKLVNVYLKATLVCGGHELHPKVAALHPPIDRLLFHGLSQENVGGRARDWRRFRDLGWSNFDSVTYESAIDALRSALPAGSPFWMIEEFWPGFQGARGAVEE